MSDNIFDYYSPYQLRQIFVEKEWPKDFIDTIHREIAYELLDSWLENVDDETYDERVRNIIENLTYGYEDEDGNAMIDFIPNESK
jgi:ABC-type Zn uptake system ZnuABC Zn-binding protein ZnuA